jgi:hypothetical protein
VHHFVWTTFDGYSYIYIVVGSSGRYYI